MHTDGAVIKSSEFQDERNEASSSDDSDAEESENDSGMEENESADEGLGWKGDSDAEADENDENEDGQSTDDDEYDAQNGDNGAGSSDESDGSDDDEANVIDSSLTWKDNLAQKARTAYLERQANSTNLMKMVYGVFTAVS